MKSENFDVFLSKIKDGERPSHSGEAFTAEQAHIIREHIDFNSTENNSYYNQVIKRNTDFKLSSMGKQIDRTLFSWRKEVNLLLASPNDDYEQDFVITTYSFHFFRWKIFQVSKWMPLED